MSHDVWELYHEYANASASSLNQIYIDPIGFSLLQPTAISEYLALGSGLNFTLGYILKSNFGFDIGYSAINPEYEENLSSVVTKTNDIRFSLTKYFLENNLKISSTFSSTTNSDDSSSSLVSIIMQLRL